MQSLSAIEEICEYNYINSKGSDDNKLINSTVLLFIDNVFLRNMFQISLQDNFLHVLSVLLSHC